MKRLINGLRMLDDIENKKITSLEKLIYLVIIFGPQLIFVEDSLAGSLIKSEKIIEWLVFIFSLALFYIFFKKNKETDIIEKYVCLSVSAIITSYLFFIPLGILFEALFRRFISFIPKENFEIYFDYFLLIYIPFYAPVCFFFWTQKKRNRSK